MCDVCDEFDRWIETIQKSNINPKEKDEIVSFLQYKKDDFIEIHEGR